MAEFIGVSKIGEPKDGAIKAVDVAGREALLAGVADEYYAADNRCPHMGGNLSQGKLEGTEVACPGYGSQFDSGNLSRGAIFSYTFLMGSRMDFVAEGKEYPGDF